VLVRAMTDPDPPKPGMLRICVEHTPSPFDPKGADEYYKEIGLLVVAWGRLEGHFVACLLTLLAMDEGHELGEQLPMDWKRRATMWRKAFETFTVLRPFKEAAMQLVTQIDDAALDRHAVVHSLWERFRPEEQPTIDCVTIKAKNKTRNGLEVRRFPITLSSLQEARKTINNLNMALLPLSNFITRYRIAQKPPPSDIRTV
jgi:hypothetical protein